MKRFKMVGLNTKSKLVTEIVEAKTEASALKKWNQMYGNIAHRCDEIDRVRS